MAVTRNYPKVNYPQLIIKTYAMQRPSLVSLPKTLMLGAVIALVLCVIASAMHLPQLPLQNLLSAGQLWVALWRTMFQATQVVMEHYLFAIL